VNSWLNVTRYHLIQRTSYLVLPWAWLAFAFAIDLVILALIPIGHHQVMTAAGPAEVVNAGGRTGYGLLSVAIVFFVLGVQAVASSLPFALALGASRRGYWTGTAVLTAGLAVGYGLVITGLQALERATGGWGLSAHVFQVPYILAGPWYLTWLTASAVLALLFVYGMWFGLVYRRWSLAGGLAFSAAQATGLAAAALVITWCHGWAGTGRFFTTLSAAGLTGLLAALAAALLTGGYVTMRRAPV
jgi:hypothetical protein